MPAHASTILFWNIRAGGGPTRAQAILLELLSHEPDLVVLAECRPTFAGQITTALRDHGLTYRLQAETTRRQNSIVITSRTPLTEPTDATLALTRPRLIHTQTLGISLTACHIPDASARTARVNVLAETHRAASLLRDQPHLILGDFNANRADHPRRDGTAIGRLAALGYNDLWLHQGGDPTDPTWAGPRNAARIDHAYASKPLVSQVESILQTHTPREAGLSDHSLLKLRVIHKTP